MKLGPRLDRSFYQRAVLAVARQCIGKVLVRRDGNRTLAGRIVEAEAYRGPKDLAAHSANGRRTARNEVMYGPAGHAYVFILYGMHWHFNLVTGVVDQPQAVLIRALEPIAGLEHMSRNRGCDAAALELTNGPGKLCQALCIDGNHYGDDLATSTKLYLADGPPTKVERSKRIGVDYAGPWADRPWRFSEVGNPYVSKRAKRVK